VVDVRLALVGVEDALSVELERQLRVHHHCHWALLQGFLELAGGRLPQAVEVVHLHLGEVRRFLAVP